MRLGLKEKKKKSKKIQPGLRIQLTMPFVVLILLSVGIVAFFSYNFSVKTTTDELSKSVEQQMFGLNHTFDMYFEFMENMLSRMAEHTSVIEYSDDDYVDLYNYLEETQNLSSDIKAVYAGYDRTEEIIIYPYDNDIRNVNPKERVWYQNAVEKEGEVIWTEPYDDALTGEPVISAAKGIYRYDDFVGVAGIDVSTGTLLNLLADIEIGENGYAIVVDQNGTLITSPDPSRIGENISEEHFFAEMLAQGDQGVIESNFDGKEVIIGFIKNPTTNWYLAGVIDKSEFAEKANVIIPPILLSLFIVLTITIIAAAFVTNRITKPISQLQQAMKTVEEGDLTASFSLQRQDELGMLSRSFNHMVNEMRTVINRISENSLKIADASQNLVASSEENTASSNEVAKTMEEIAAGASEQADLTEQNAEAFHTLSAVIADIKEKNEEMYKKAQDMGELSVSGLRTLKSLAIQSAETKDFANRVIQASEQLNEQSMNVNTIVDKIADIAGQTNLLALNASIEAARAGEHGHGFSVVASEVGKLAEETTEALKEIADIVSNMQDETKQSMDLVGKMIELFEEQNDIISETGQSFMAISNSVNENSEMTEEIMELTNTIVEKEKQLMKSTENYASISEDTAAGTEEISAAIEEQSAAMEQLTHLASELDSIASDMQEEIKRFNIG